MHGAKLAAVSGVSAISLALAPAAAAAPPVPAVQCNVGPGSPASQMTTEPWPQQMLNFTDVWSLTRGQGATVAIVDSGVDDTHSQLPRIQTIDDTGTGKQDCQGHGTMVAGIIAAQDRRNQHIPFLGVAPRVNLISIKVATQEQNNDPALLAQGIRQAANLGADIINVSITAPDLPALRSAVQFAEGRGALIVAAAGNTEQGKKASEQALYPASYNGVISVGAIGRDGTLQDFSDAKSRVGVVAPGKQVISTWPRNSYASEDGTSFAAPYVAATAALVKSYHPRLTGLQIAHRIEATADGGTAFGSGHGMVDPLRAVTAVLPEEVAPGVPTAVQPHPVAILQPQHQSSFTHQTALLVIGVALGVAGLIAVGGIVIPAGRRRGWRPERRATSPAAKD